MKRKAVNLIGIVIMTVVVVFSLIQLNISAVSAEICPPGWAVGCGCQFQYGIDTVSGGEMHRTCYYMCSCEGGWEPMTIEMDY